MKTTESLFPFHEQNPKPEQESGSILGQSSSPRYNLS